MRRYRRLILFSLLAVALLVGAEYALAPTAKRRLVKEIERATGVRPSVGTVSLSLWRGSATVRDLVVPNPKPFLEPILIEASSVTVNLALAPLLSRELVVQKVALKRARVTLERDFQGQTNIDTILGRFSGSPGAAKGTPVRVDKVSLTDSSLLLVDHTLKSPPERLLLEDVEAEVRDIDTSRPYDTLHTSFEAKAVIATPHRGRLLAHGRTNPFSPDVNFEMELTLEGLDLPLLQHFYPASPVVFRDGTADLYSSAVCRHYRLDSRNRLVLHNLYFLPKGQALEVVGLPVQTVLAYLQREEKVELAFSLSGDVRHPKADLKPAMERLVAQALRGRVLGTTKELVDGGWKGIGTQEKVISTSKRVGEVVVEGARKLVSAVKSLFGR